MYTGPKIVKDNSLVLYYDTGNSKSYVGEPTTNLVTSPINFNGGWVSYSNGNDGMFLTEFGTMGYRMINQLAWNGVYMNFNLVSSGTYTFSAKIRYWNKSGGCNGGAVYVSNYGAGDVNTLADTSIIGKWQTVSKVVNVTSPTDVYFYLISWGGSGTDSSTWEVTQPQIELKSHSTSFTQGTRSVTQGLLTLNQTKVFPDLTYMTYDATSDLWFNGSSSYIDCGNDTSLQLGTAITISAWVNIASTATSGNIVSKNQNSGFRFRVGTDYKLWWYVSGNVISGGMVTPNTWIYLTVVGSVAGLSAYIDGVLVASNTTPYAPTSPTSGNLFIGTYGGSEYFNGKISSVKIFNRALSANEILNDFKSLSVKYETIYYFTIRTFYHRSGKNVPSSIAAGWPNGRYTSEGEDYFLYSKTTLVTRAIGTSSSVNTSRELHIDNLVYNHTWETLIDIKVTRKNGIYTFDLIRSNGAVFGPKYRNNEWYINKLIPFLPKIN